eukprot:TRINITY_DN2367_c0_g1_i1.p2 TRINITY_DN2367_c0_g1~~TRINITY_DN2367_c0_g1_i1.p2  ORF type:complete len:119 (+),score=20.90 TRINITY_DN2367_c0_g1_i1:844-1200(+)
MDKEMEALGLHDEHIMIRMTGCPNGCARPFVAEIGFVGKAPGIYNLYLGGGHAGNRLNKLYKEAVNETQILKTLKPILGRYAKEKIMVNILVISVFELVSSEKQPMEGISMNESILFG